MEIEEPRRKKVASNSLFYPLVLLTLTIFINVIYQTSQLLNAEENLLVLRANQDKAVTDSGKVRAQFDTIATETAALAAQGNNNARLIIAHLKKQGINIKP